MQSQIVPSSPELIAADKALRRAAANVKKQAEKQGTPYVVYRDSNNEKFLNEKQANAKAK